MTDFWPDDVGQAPEITPPLTILKAAASDLMRKTKQILQCNIVTASDAHQMVRHMMMIIAPAVGDYRFQVLEVSHNILLYPLTVSSGGRAYRCENEADFVKTLRAELATERVKKVIGSLLVQSQSL